jgi:hypothetical protein
MAERIQELIEVNVLCGILLERLEQLTLPVSEGQVTELREMCQRAGRGA